MTSTARVPLPASTLELLHLELGGARCLASTRGFAEDKPPTAVVLFIPPFAEEMNKGRRQLSLTAQALAAKGVASVLPDLPGTGDSEGELTETSLTEWQSAMADSAKWIASSRAPGVPIVMVGLRLGALLGLSVWPEVARWVRGACWVAPVLHGEQHLTQFLRLAVAGAALRGETGPSTKSLRQQLSAEGRVEVAGYTLGSALVAGLDSLRAAALTPQGPSHVIEVISREDVPLALPLQSCLDVWRSASHAVSFEQTVGESFWASTEVTVVEKLPALIVDAVAKLTRGST